MSESERRLTGDPAADHINTGPTDDMDIMNLFQDYFVEGDDTNVRPPASKESKATQTNTEELQLEGKLPEIKDLCLRSDLSALAKIDQILSLIDPSLVQRVNTTPTPPRTEAGKRPADLSAGNVGISCSKIPKFDPEIEKDIKLEMMDSGGCAVCGISLTEFRNDSTRELVHYLRYQTERHREHSQSNLVLVMA